ncbi:hypothetical protein ACIHAA_31280 [Streptomyces sp. NPDC052040]|uniref:Rv1733c family protein n=1 Tax=Streptomyces sp. NPDC052040 TaxID=3365682 RepID=UPI0037D25D10
MAVPSASWAAGSVTYAHHDRLRETQLAALHPVRARLESDARTAADRPTGKRGQGALVRWSDRQGAHTATATVSPRLRAGDTTTIWLDGRGTVAAPPVTTTEAVSTAVGVGLVTAAGATVIVGGVWQGVRRALDRRRFAQWDHEWETVEPQWTMRHPR